MSSSPCSECRSRPRLRSRRATLRALGAALAGLVAGCSGSDAEPRTTATAASTATSTPTPPPRSTNPASSTDTDTDQPPETATPPESVRWAITTDAPVTGIVPGVNASLVAVATAGGVLSARRVADGTDVWRLAAPAPAADGPTRREFGSRAATGRGFLARDGTLFAISGRFDGLHRFDDAVHAVDPTDGTERWRHAPGRSYAAFGIVGAVDGAVVVGDNDDALGSGDHRTVAIDAATGAVRWTNTSGDVLAGTVGAGAAFTADATTLSAYDAADGSVRWTRDLSGIRWLELAAGGEPLYAGVGGTRLVAIDPATGGTRWELAADAGDAIVDEAVYVGGTRVRRVAPDGTVVWASDPPDLERPAALGPDRLFVAGDGTVGAVSRSTGAEEWRVAVDTSYTPTVTVGDGDGPAVVGTETALTAVDAGSGQRRWTFDPGVGPLSETTVGESAAYVAATPGEPQEGPGRVYARPLGE